MQKKRIIKKGGNQDIRFIMIKTIIKIKLK